MLLCVTDLRLAVISDAHGNAYALDAVLSEVRAETPDLILNLGDQVEGSADPARAYEMQAAWARWRCAATTRRNSGRAGGAASCRNGSARGSNPGSDRRR